MTDAAVVHDRFRTLGGAERVACELARALDAPIYAGRVDDGIAPDDIELRELFDSRVGQLAMRSHYLVQDAYQMLAWQHVNELYEYDTIILNKANPAWFVPREQQTVAWYLHSTPRGFYDQFARGSDPGLVTSAIKGAMRSLWGPNRVHPDAWLCNSELVQRRLECYCGVSRDDLRSRVVYPPVDVASFGPDRAPTGDRYLCLGRLRNHKRVGDAIRAIGYADAALDVAGTGPERERLEQLAADVGATVEFHGYVDADRKAELLARAQALIMPAENEDFGLTPVEAFASGTPVIAVNEGFSKHQVADGVTGLVYERDGDGKGLSRALRRFDESAIDSTPAERERVAQRCAVPRFREQIRDAVAWARERATVDADWTPPESAETTPAPVAADGGGADGD